MVATFISAKNHGTVVEYKVDGFNRRVKKLVNDSASEYYIWYDQTRLAAILDSNKQPKLIYIYGPESSHSPSFIVKDNHTYKIIHDPGTGSVRYVVDPVNTLIMQELEYDEFGNMMKNTNPDFQPITYTGGLYDKHTKFIKLGARDYDSTVGRWTTKDPIGFNGGDTNLYAYVGGDPMSYVDPSGRFGIAGGTVGFISGAIGGYTTGGFWGGVAGGVAGGVIGLAVPSSSGVIGAAIGGSAANFLGQIFGNGLTDQSLLSIDGGQVIASGFAGAAGTAGVAAFGIRSVASQVAFSTATDLGTTLVTQPIQTGPVDFCRIANGKTCTLNQMCGGK